MDKFMVSPSPHIRSTRDTSVIMLDVIIALIPAGAFSIYLFGIRSLLVIAACILSAVLFEDIYCMLNKRPSTTGNLSAAVTGLLLAYNLPPGIPLWIAIIGSGVAIIIVKELFGGIGHNFVNPALAARIFLLASWPAAMTSWILPRADAVTGPTPLALIKGKEIAGASLPTYHDLFIGNIGGCIGETSKVLLLLGALYLLFRKVISWHIPISFIATVALLTWIFGGSTPFSGDYIYHILSGGLILGAFFMATDYTTSPMTRAGHLVMGIGCGFITAVIRLFGGYPEGVSYAILLMNLLVPLIDRYSIPRSFGGGKIRA